MWLPGVSAMEADAGKGMNTGKSVGNKRTSESSVRKDSPLCPPHWAQQVGEPIREGEAWARWGVSWVDSPKGAPGLAQKH